MLCILDARLPKGLFSNAGINRGLLGFLEDLLRLLGFTEGVSLGLLDGFLLIILALAGLNKGLSLGSLGALARLGRFLDLARLEWFLARHFARFLLWLGLQRASC